MPRLQPTSGTLVVVAAGRTAGYLPSSNLTIHGSGGWVSLGAVSGLIPAAPDELGIAYRSVAAGAYDQVRLGPDTAPIMAAVASGQVEPLLLGIQSGRLLPGAAYAGNDQHNLGLGELAGRFVPMPPFALVDQHGRPFSSASTAGRDVVVAAFHTSCHETCPLYTALFAQLSARAPVGVVLAEVTTDPLTDTPSTLDGYARNLGASWTFATGSAQSLSDFWKPLGVQLAAGDVHVSTVALLDSHGYVRLVYRGVPDVGHAIDPALVTSLSAAGLRELASGGDGWGAPDIIQALVTISGPARTPDHPSGPAPPFALTGTDGVRVDSDSLRGQALVVNFWASYCPPCRAEMPLLARDVSGRSTARLVLIDEGDNSAAAKAFLDSLGLTQPALLDSDLGTGRAYGAIALPTTVFIAKNGTIVSRNVGQLDESVLLTQLGLLAG